MYICSRADEDEFLIIACDGVWDAMSSQTLVDIVREYLPSIRAGIITPSDVVLKIFDQCISPDPDQYIGGDNMTMILVVFGISTSFTGENIEAELSGQSVASPTISAGSVGSTPTGFDAEKMATDLVGGILTSNATDIRLPPEVFGSRRNSRKLTLPPIPIDTDTAVGENDQDEFTFEEYHEPSVPLGRYTHRAPSFFELVEALPMEDFLEVEIEEPESPEGGAKVLLSPANRSPKRMPSIRLSLTPVEEDREATQILTPITPCCDRMSSPGNSTHPSTPSVRQLSLTPVRALPLDLAEDDSISSPTHSRCSSASSEGTRPSRRRRSVTFVRMNSLPDDTQSDKCTTRVPRQGTPHANGRAAGALLQDPSVDRFTGAEMILNSADEDHAGRCSGRCFGTWRRTVTPPTPKVRNEEASGFFGKIWLSCTRLLDS
jgi:hypothetical protein